MVQVRRRARTVLSDQPPYADVKTKTGKTFRLAVIWFLKMAETLFQTGKAIHVWFRFFFAASKT